MANRNVSIYSGSTIKPENPDSELDGLIKRKEDKPDKKASLLKIANNSIASGLNQFNQGLASTLDFLMPTEFLGKYDVFSNLNDYYSGLADKYGGQLEESVSDRSKAVQIGAKALETATSAAPNALLAVMSGGSSAAAQGSTAALTATSAAMGKTAAANAIHQTVKNPLYWSSVAQSLGNNYESSEANGVNELQAIGSAFTSSLLNAAVEAGGGTETLPNVLKQGSIGPATAWAKSALTEGAEESVQSAVSGAIEKLFFDKDKPMVSLSDRSAVIHPGRMAEEFAMGAAVGGILGAGQFAGNRLAAADPMVRARQGDYSGLMQQFDDFIQTKKRNELMVEYGKHMTKASNNVQTEDNLDAVAGSNYDKQKEVELYGKAGVGGTGQADRKGQSGNIDIGRGETLRHSVQRIYEGKTVHGWPERLTPESVRAEEPARKWVVENIIEPRHGSVAYTEQQLSKEYNIPCFVVSDNVWEQNKGDVPAFAAGGQIYLKETLPEENRGMFVAHEATHVMRQVNYQPYIDFIRGTPDLLNIRTRAAQRLIEGCAEHNGIDLMNMTETDVDTLYDEINATVFGSIAKNDEIALSYVRPAFQNFDAYLSELAELHQQFKNHRFQDKLEEKIDAYWKD